MRHDHLTHNMILNILESVQAWCLEHDYMPAVHALANATAALPYQEPVARKIVTKAEATFTTIHDTRYCNDAYGQVFRFDGPNDSWLRITSLQGRTLEQAIADAERNRYG